MIVDVPSPLCKKGGVLVDTAYSLVSAGTEKMLFEFGKKGLIGKARERPDQVRKIMDKIATDGLFATVKTAFNKLAEPLPLGYSCVGRIVETDLLLTDFHKGDTVACAGLTANHAERVFVPKNLVVPIPLDFEDIREAAFVALGAIAMQGIRQAECRFGDWVGVIGLGLLGQLTIRILKAAGCRVIGFDIDPSKEVLARAPINNLDAFIDIREDNASEKVLALTAHGCDSIVITASTSSNQPVEFAAEIARDRAIVTMVGVTEMNLPRRPFYQKELDFRFSRSYGPGRYDSNFEEKGIDYPIGYIPWTEKRNMQEFIRMLHEKKISVRELLTHEFEIEKANDAYELITENPKQEKYAAVLLKYPLREEKKERIVVSDTEFKKVEGKIGVGFIGAGNFMKNVILPNMAKIEDYQLIAVSATTGTSIGQLPRKIRLKYTTTEYQGIMHDPDIDLVVIATAHDTHAKFAIEALDAGKHVYVEKPLAINEEQLKQVEEAYYRNKQHLFVGFNRRYSPFAKFIKENLQTDQYPCMIQYTINAGYIPKEHWINDPEVGGGRVIGEVCHFIDLVVFLTGSPAKEIQVVNLNTESGHYSSSDNISINLSFQNGSIANIVYTSMGSKSYPKERVTIFCNGKVGEIDNFVSATIFGKHKKTLKKVEQDKGFLEEYREISKIIKENSGKRAIDQFSGNVETTKASLKVARGF